MLTFFEHRGEALAATLEVDAPRRALTTSVSALVCYNKDVAVRSCVTTETRPLDRLGQLGEYARVVFAR